ncbi:alcohol dehydrogenase, partial [Cellulomonas bogoriensis 69B4 = DSM 16987]
MRAVRFDRFGGPLEVALVPEPECPDDGAVVRVEATGVCRSDWHAWQGHDPDVTLPHVPGHEMAGTVLQVGTDVRRWRPGDRVTVPFVQACGTCGTCRAGEHQVCPAQTQPGFTHDGTFAEKVALHHADVNLVALPEAMTAVTAAALGCRFATAYRALMAHGRVLAGEWVVVHGCGGLGLSLVMIAAAGGANVLAIDVSPAALTAARDAGATQVLDATGMTPEVVGTHVADLTDGGGHVSVDACGSAATAV